MYANELLLFKFAPMVFLGLFLMLNVCVTISYFKAIKKPFNELTERNR